MRAYRRAMHFDFHTMPGFEHLLSGFDAEAFASKLEENHVEFINFPARCNIGFSYYQTKVGAMYPGLTRDILGEVIDACHRHGIGVCAYINGGLNHEMASCHHGWCRMDRSGRIYGKDKVDNFFRTMCWNSRYRRYFLAEVREILAYDIDGLFVDCMVTRECYCPSCRAAMEAEGREITPDSVMAYQGELVRSVMAEVKAMVPNDIYLYFNSCAPDPALDTHAEVECLPSSKLWGSDYFYPASSFQRGHFTKKVYMTGRFQDCWGDFGGIKTTEAMQNDLYDAMLAGYDLSIADHLHPIDGLFDEVIHRVGRVFEEKMRYEPYTEGTSYAAEIGVLVADDEYYAPDVLRGVARMLNELKLPYHTHTADDDYRDKRLLILPKALPLSDKQGEALRTYVEEGGKVLFVGTAIDTAVALGLDDGITLLGEDPCDNAYFTFPNETMRWGMYRPSRRIKAKGGEELAAYVPGVFNLVYDGKHTYYYRPQGEAGGLSAAVVGAYGAYLCYDAFLAYADTFLRENKRLVKAAIDALLPRKRIEVEKLPSTSIIGITEKPSHAVLHIKTTHPAIRNGRGIVEEHTFVPLARLSVEGQYRVYELPQKAPVDVIYEDGRTVFEATDILGYRAYLLET